MILNATLCDYIRLTTFAIEDYQKMLETWNIVTAGAETEDARIMQYGGKQYAHGFLGTGMQNRRPHYLTHYSGTAAAIAWYTIMSHKWLDVRCTRLDAQITIPLPDQYKSMDLFQKLNGKLPYGRVVTLYKSGDGMDTIYLGKRATKNGRVTRIYVKEYVGGKALRWETEYKGDWSVQHWDYLQRGGTLEELLVAELESVGDIDFEPLATFYGLLRGKLPAPRPTAVETSNPTLDWLLKTVDPVLRRMLNDHDHGSKVRHWLELLLDWS